MAVRAAPVRRAWGTETARVLVVAARVDSDASCSSLCPIADVSDPCLMRAIRATIHLPVRLDAMPDDLASAMRACRRDRVNRAFEAVEDVCATAKSNFERLVVFVPADLASRHDASFFRSYASRASAGDMPGSSWVRFGAIEKWDGP